MGVERHSNVMSEDEKRMTAYHEAGHTIVGLLVPDHDPVYKVSIIPRGRALGVTMYLPEKDQYSMSLQQIESRIMSLYGGRIAEEIIFGADKVTTGASNDIEKATELARNTVTRWGLSAELGPINYGTDEGEVFLGKSVSRSNSVSGQTANRIDEEVKKMIETLYKQAEEILKANVDKLHTMADALMKYETIDANQISTIMEGEALPDPEGSPSVSTDEHEDKDQDGEETDSNETIDKGE